VFLIQASASSSVGKLILVRLMMQAITDAPILVRNSTQYETATFLGTIVIVLDFTFSLMYARHHSGNTRA